MQTIISKTRSVSLPLIRSQIRQQESRDFDSNLTPKISINKLIHHNEPAYHNHHLIQHVSDRFPEKIHRSKRSHHTPNNFIPSSGK